MSMQPRADAAGPRPAPSIPADESHANAMRAAHGAAAAAADLLGYAITGEPIDYDTLLNLVTASKLALELGEQPEDQELRAALAKWLEENT